MSQELDKSINQMRAEVLIRLAERNKLYVDAFSVQILVNGRDDSEAWSCISQSNAGFLGFCRRLLSRVRNRSKYRV